MHKGLVHGQDEEVRIMIKNHILVAIMALAIVPATAKANPSAANCPRTKPEARSLRAVECPAFWPINQGSPLKAAQYSNYPDSPDPLIALKSAKGGKFLFSMLQVKPI
jgi:hypothetical protein